VATAAAVADSGRSSSTCSSAFHLQATPHHQTHELLRDPTAAATAAAAAASAANDYSDDDEKELQ